MTTVFGVSGCVLDLNANDSESIEIVEGKVASWTDSAGSRVFSQGTADKRPVMVTLNGEPAVEFDGVDDTLAFIGSLSFPRPTTYVLVGNLDEIPEANATPFSVRPSINGIAPIVHYDAENKFSLAWKGSFFGGGPTPFTDPFLAVTTVDATTAQLNVNGTAYEAATVSGEISGTSSYVGSLENNQFWPGSLARILAFDHAVTEQEMLAIRYGTITDHGFDQPENQRILRVRRGRAGTHPVDHPADTTVRVRTGGLL